MNPYWSYLLTAVGVFGLWLAGRKDHRGWMVGVGAQVLWIAYATATQQWGFYVSALAYGWVYIKNAKAWKEPKPQTKLLSSTGGFYMLEDVKSLEEANKIRELIAKELLLRQLTEDIRVGKITVNQARRALGYRELEPNES